MNDKRGMKQQFFIGLLLLSVGFLGLIIGMGIFYTKLWPYDTFRNAFRAAKAWKEKLSPQSPYQVLYHRTRYKKSGVFQYQPQKAYNGLTLFTSKHASKAFLISMTGQIVHEWALPFSKVWTQPPHIPYPVSERFIHWRKAYLYPNGDLLAIYIAAGDTPWGYGLVKMDKDSNLIWKYAGRVHHDVEVDPEGKIYTLTHKIVKEKVPGIRLEPPLLEDSIVVLSPEGQELKKVSISKAFRESNFSNLLGVLQDSAKKGDPWHTNTVEVLTDSLADKFPFLQAGQVLICLRNADTIAAIDLEAEKVVWVTRGVWHKPHDPDFLANGHMMIFDNRGYYGPGGISRVIEFNPITMEIVWQYTGTQEDPLFSWTKSAQQRLPNGNTLITESRQGRLLEVTQEKEIVWTFISPFRVPNTDHLIASIHWGQRFHPETLHFELSHPVQDDIMINH